jgi:predicted secreted protein
LQPEWNSRTTGIVVPTARHLFGAGHMLFIKCFIVTAPALALVCGYGCSFPGKDAFYEARPMQTSTLTQRDAGKWTTVGIGDVVVVSLDETPATGYRWTITHDASPVLHLLESAYVAQTDQKGLGAAGTHQWKFEARTTGDAQLVFRQSRAWVPGDPSAETVKIGVHVAQ